MVPEFTIPQKAGAWYFINQATDIEKNYNNGK
jgi:hypothetical protein